jgi:hypothetical protein
VQRDQAAIDCGMNSRTIFRNAAASIQKLPVDRANVQPAGVIRFHGVGDIQQFFDGGVEVGEGPVSCEFHLAHAHSGLWKVRPHICAFLTARLVGKARLDIGQPDIIRPAVTADRCRMAAPVVGAIDQQTANARGAHFSEGDLLLALHIVA